MKLILATSMLLLTPFAFAQSGHWEGAILVPEHDVGIQVDIAPAGKDAWKGTLAIPEQNVKMLPLSSIGNANGIVKFAVQGPPSAPAFEGKLAADGQSISGNVTQGSAVMPFKLKRTGDAKFVELPKSTPVDKAIEGNWEGALDVNGQTLHLLLKLANENGAATGTATSVDQGGAVIPIGVITQTGSTLKLEVPGVGGSYTGEVAKDGSAISGTWTQGQGALPLVFHRPAPAK
jgi:hypothetical protein